MAESDLMDLNDQGGLWDWEIYSADQSRLVVVGGADLTYHHEVAVTFEDVAYLRAPWSFSHPTFRLASNAEVDGVVAELGGLDDVLVYAADVESIGSETTFLVAAARVTVVHEVVLRYPT